MELRDEVFNNLKCSQTEGEASQEPITCYWWVSII